MNDSTTSLISNCTHHQIMTLYAELFCRTNRGNSVHYIHMTTSDCIGVTISFSHDIDGNKPYLYGTRSVTFPPFSNLPNQ